MSKDEDESRRLSQGKVSAAILRSVVFTVLGALAVTYPRTSKAKPYCLASCWIAPASLRSGRWSRRADRGVVRHGPRRALWRHRRSILDLFLMVVLCAYLIEIPPHYYHSSSLQHGLVCSARHQPDFEQHRAGGLAVRDYGACMEDFSGRCFVSGGSARLPDDRGRRRGSIAHEVRQPLTAMVTSADAGLRLLNRSGARSRQGEGGIPDESSQTAIGLETSSAAFAPTSERCAHTEPRSTSMS